MSLETIQGLWIGKLGLLEQLSMYSFLAHGHHYHLYVYDDVGQVPKGVVVKDANEIMPESDIFTYQKGNARGGYSGFANIFRYRLLQLRGGWWCDTDVICLKPFQFPSDIVIASERHWLFPNKICNNVIRCPQGHALMQQCFQDAQVLMRKPIRFAENGEPILKKNVRKLELKRYIQPPETFNPIGWYASDFLTKKYTAIPNASYAIHCYRETWRWRLKQQHEIHFRNALFSENTILGTLQKMYLPPALRETYEALA